MSRRFALIAAALVGAALSIPPSFATTTASVNAAITITPTITFAPSALVFGNVVIGSPVTQTTTLTNAGVATISFTIALGSGSNSSAFSLTTDCAGTLAVGVQCHVSVTFAPSTVGSANSTLQIAGNGQTYSAGLSGAGVSSAPAVTLQSITLSPSSIQIQDSATGGSIVSTATLHMSDGSTSCPTCTLSSSDTHYYTVSGLNIVLAHSLTSADDGSHPTTITGIGP